MNVELYHLIKRKRGALICERKEGYFSSVGAAAASFGLHGDDSCYRKIEPDDAERILTSVLWKGMAYGVELVAYESARALAQGFLAVESLASDFYTNSVWSAAPDGEYLLRSWSPGTDATFNVGIIVLSVDSVACVWVEDED